LSTTFDCTTKGTAASAATTITMGKKAFMRLRRTGRAGG
jgi:hypothetical protein